MWGVVLISFAEVELDILFVMHIDDDPVVERCL
jgi:hypothetical protein